MTHTEATNKVVEMHERNNMHLVQRLTWLTERNHALEQLVKGGLYLIDPYAVPDNGLMDWCLCAQALVGLELWPIPEQEDTSERTERL